MYYCDSKYDQKKKNKNYYEDLSYLIGWVLQFTLFNLLNDIVFLPQIQFDGIEIDEVDNWES